MSDHDRLDHLLHDIARDRAGPRPKAPPGPVLDRLRARGRGRRRRKVRAAAAAGVAAVVLGLLGVARLADRSDGTERIDAVDTGSTTTTVEPSPPATAGEPAIGAPASAYVGVAVVQDPEDGDVWTADGRSLGHITAEQVQGDLTGGRSVLEARDGERLLLWLLGGTWPEPSTILDAVEAPAGSDLAGGCSAAGPDRDVVAVIDRATGSDDPTVVSAWTVGPDDRLTAVATLSDVTCAGLAGA